MINGGKNTVNILILTGKFGQGHYAAADALATEIKHSLDAPNIYIKDIFVHALKKKSKVLYGSFSFMIKRGSRIYNLVYKRTEHQNKNTRLLLKRHFIHSMEQLIKDTKADIIISTLTFCSKVVSIYKRETGHNIPLITCITDFTPHVEWIYPETDLYLAAAPVVRNLLKQKGIPEDHILVCGIPVREEFKIGKREAHYDERRLLIMGGGLGLLPKSNALYEKLDQLPNIKTTVITGNNKLLYDTLKNTYSNIVVLGYVNDVYRYMFQADLLLTKPGGITTLEAIYAELPLLMFHPILEQEVENEKFIMDNKLGIELSSETDTAITEIQNIIQDNELLAHIRSNMRCLKSSFNEGRFQAALIHYAEHGNIS